MNDEKQHPTPIPDVVLSEAAERFGTPLYLYDLERVRAQLERFRAALPEAAICYAVKANPSGALLRLLGGLGVGAEVITLGELERAIRAGIPGARIVLGGPGQDTPLMMRALEHGVALVSLDSVSQWRLWQALGPEGTRFLVRLNPALDPRTHEHLATGAATSKFGMTPAEAQQVAGELGGRLAGFHVHIGSQISAVDVYDEVFAQLGALHSAFGEARLLDIGGGFGVPGFALEGFADKLRRFASAHALSVVLEPGRYLVAEAGLLLSRVLHVKAGARRHVIADAGMADLLRPALYGAAHPVRVLGKAQAEPTEADVDGPLCENADRLGRGLALPGAVRGDLLVVQEAGAYGFGMASNYASSLRPAEAVWDGGALHLARRRETVDDLLRLEC